MWWGFLNDKKKLKIAVISVVITVSVIGAIIYINKGSIFNAFDSFEQPGTESTEDGLQRLDYAEYMTSGMFWTEISKISNSQVSLSTKLKIYTVLYGSDYFGLLRITDRDSKISSLMQLSANDKKIAKEADINGRKWLKLNLEQLRSAQAIKRQPKLVDQLVANVYEHYKVWLNFKKTATNNASANPNVSIGASSALYYKEFWSKDNLEILYKVYWPDLYSNINTKFFTRQEVERLKKTNAAARFFEEGAIDVTIETLSWLLPVSLPEHLAGMIMADVAVVAGSRLATKAIKPFSAAVSKFVSKTKSLSILGTRTSTLKLVEPKIDYNSLLKKSTITTKILSENKQALEDFIYNLRVGASILINDNDAMNAILKRNTYLTGQNSSGLFGKPLTREYVIEMQRVSAERTQIVTAKLANNNVSELELAGDCFVAGCAYKYYWRIQINQLGTFMKTDKGIVIRDGIESIVSHENNHLWSRWQEVDMISKENIFISKKLGHNPIEEAATEGISRNMLRKAGMPVGESAYENLGYVQWWDEVVLAINRGIKKQPNNQAFFDLTRGLNARQVSFEMYFRHGLHRLDDVLRPGLTLLAQELGESPLKVSFELFENGKKTEAINYIKSIYQ